MQKNAAPHPVVYELIWWVFTIVVAVLVLLPIYTHVPDFPYFVPNFVYVVAAITLTRYLFFLKISWLRDRLLLQAIIAMALLPLIFWMVQYFNEFITYRDEQGPDVFVRHLGRETGQMLDRYLLNEYKFFGVWAVVAALATPFRLVANVWLRYRAGVKAL